MNKSIIHTAGFRILSPLLMGVITYLLVLLSFDRLDNILLNFDLTEFTFCLIVSFLLLEFLHLCLISRFAKDDPGKLKRSKILLQSGLIFIGGLVLLAVILYGYFSLILKYLNFTSFSAEFYILLIIFSLASVSYLLFCTSLLLLNARNEKALLIEKEKEKYIEQALGQLKRDIHPALFFKTLEEILILVPEEKNIADQLLGKLSTLYRHILSQRSEPWISLKKELDQVEIFITLYRHWSKGNISLEGKKLTTSYYLLPGTLRMLISELLPLSILSPAHHFHISYKIDPQKLSLDLSFYEKISKEAEVEACFDSFIQHYTGFSSKSVEIEKKHHSYSLTIPLLELEGTSPAYQFTPS